MPMHVPLYPPDLTSSIPVRPIRNWQQRLLCTCMYATSGWSPVPALPGPRLLLPRTGFAMHNIQSWKIQKEEEEVGRGEEQSPISTSGPSTIICIWPTVVFCMYGLDALGRSFFLFLPFSSYYYYSGSCKIPYGSLRWVLSIQVLIMYVCMYVRTVWYEKQNEPDRLL